MIDEQTTKWPARGDYVLATKYSDGDAGDHFCVGYYRDAYDHFGSLRHIVVDKDGKPFRANGFRRVARVSARRGNWIVRHLSMIEGLRDVYSVWHWYRAPWRELDAVDTFLPPERSASDGGESK